MQKFNFLFGVAMFLGLNFSATADAGEDFLSQIREGAYIVEKDEAFYMSGDNEKIYGTNYYKGKEVKVERKGNDTIIFTFSRTGSKRTSWTQMFYTAAYDHSYHSWVHGGGAIPIFIPWRTYVVSEIRPTLTEKELKNKVTYKDGYKYAGRSYTRSVQILPDNRLIVTTFKIEQAISDQDRFYLKLR